MRDAAVVSLTRSVDGTLAPPPLPTSRVSGASSSFEETLNTLKYANRAKNIKTNATRNSLDVNHHISEYVNLIGSLRTEIARLKHQLKRPAPPGGGEGWGIAVGAGRPHHQVERRVLSFTAAWVLPIRQHRQSSNSSSKISPRLSAFQACQGSGAQRLKLRMYHMMTLSSQDQRG